MKEPLDAPLRENGKGFIQYIMDALALIGVIASMLFLI